MKKNPLHPIYRFFVFFLFVLITGMSGNNIPLANAQSSLKHGDVTADGIIDGRDALVVLRAIVGLQILTSDESDRGDVYPNPGTGGRMIGDGRLTEDDARQILRFAVRLIPEGDITSDFSGNTPVINRFEPHSGPAGTRVTIHGENFAGASPENNIVRLGGVPVPVSEITGVSIVVEITEDAQSGVFEVLTPGGSAVSSGQFTIITTTPGSLELGAGMNPETFTIVSTVDETENVDSQGNFDIGVNRDGISLIGAVSDGEANNTYLALNLPGIIADENGKIIHTRQANQALEVNAMSTAKTLIFLHPFLGTDNPVAVARLMEILDTVPEVSQLASVIGQRYPQGADGLNDPAVKTAWETAIIAVFDNLPEGLVFPIGSAAGKKSRSAATTKIQPPHASGKIEFTTLSNGLPVRLVRAGADYLEAELLTRTKEVKLGYPESLNYSPLDWYAKCYRVDPADMPIGVLNPFVAARQGIRQIGSHQSTVIPAEQWTARIDVLGYAISWAFNQAAGWVDIGAPKFRYDDTQEGVYAIRIYSGSVADTDPEDFQAITTIADGQTNANMAIVLNLSLAVLDFWSLISSSEEGFLRSALRTGMTKGLTGLVQHSSRLYPPRDESQTLDVLLVVMVEVGKGIAEAAKEAGISAARERLQETCETAGRLASGLLAALSRISSLGKIGERIAGMMGYLLNPLGWEIAPYGPTPLETFFLVVGDPFRPSITRIDPEFGAPGSEVTIYGEHFLTERENNIVTFDEYPARVVRVVDSRQMVVEAPRYLPLFQTYDVVVETGASSNAATAPTGFHTDPVPYIQAITPFEGYSPTTNENNPFHGQEGMLVQLRGSYLDLPEGNDAKQVLFNNREAEITHALPDYLTVRVPAGLTGTVRVVLRDTERNHESNAVYFDIYDPPVIRSLSSTEVRAGESFTIRGRYLHNARVKIGDQWATVVSTARNQAIVLMPTVGEENQSLRLEIWTPSGSAATQITRAEGMEIPRPVVLPQGAKIPVNDWGNTVGPDGKITLAEAVAIANGTINPFRNGYDDNNINSYTYYRRVLNTETGEYERVNAGSRSEQIPGGFGNEYHNYYDVAVDDHGNETGRTLTRSVNLDETEEDMEEGDFIQYWGRSLPEPDEFDLSPYRDQIIVSTGERISSGNLAMGPQDEIEMPQNIVWNVDGGLTISNYNKITLGGVIRAGGAITLSGNSTIVRGATIENASLILEDEIGVNMTNISILNGRGNGLEIRRGGLNQLSLNTINQCSQNGILIQDSPQCTIQVSQIERCTNQGIEIRASHQTTINIGGGYQSSLPAITNCNHGILIADSRNCTISGSASPTGPDILNCQGNGILIQNGGFHTLSDFFIQNNSLRGIQVANSEGNSIRNSMILGNQSDAICLHNGSGMNQLNHLTIYENQENGVLIQGEENNDNQLNHINIGYNRVIDQYTGNGKNGIFLTDGASGNIINNCRIFRCQENGILITGQNTFNNQIIETDVAYGYSEETAEFGNQLDGIRIVQSPGNTLLRTGIGQNNGYGIHIENSDDNRIEECTIGDPRAFMSSPAYHRPNKKRGIHLVGSSIGNIINSCKISYNLEGGLLLEDITHPNASENVPTVSVLHSFFGTNTDGTLTRNAVYPTAGPAIECKNVEYVSFNDVYVYKHNPGVLIHGDNNISIDWSDLTIRASLGKGFYAQNIQDLIMDSVISYGCADDGIHMKNVRAVFFSHEHLPIEYSPPSLADRNTGNGLYLESCRDITLTECSFHENAKSGMVLIDCQDIQFRYGWIWDNLLHGISLQNSSNIFFERIRPQRNAGCGIQIIDSENLELLGTVPPRTGFFITQNKGGGIVIENSQNIQIGKKDREGTVSNNVPEPNIVITGDQTRNVTIECCNLMDSYESECIRIDGGAGITIGSSQPGSVNNIERNGPIGVLVRGANTEAVILNNIIGEHESYESGDRQRGNDIGIVLENGASHTLIQGNIINANRTQGILIHDGANANVILRNRITENGENGVQVEGLGSRQNQITQNSISRNLQKGIRLANHGNDEVAAPVITRIEPRQNLIQGKLIADAPDGSQIEVYADLDDEGQSLIGVTQLFAKKFSLIADIPTDKNLRALIIHPGGNTSEFGETVYEGKRDNFLFTEYKNNTSDIYLYNFVTDNATRLTHSAANDTHPSLSSDGNQMLFVSDRQGNPDIWLLPFDTFEPIAVVDNPAPDYDPDWTTDGSKLVYVSERDGNPEIYLQPAVTGASGGEIFYHKGDQDTVADMFLRSANARDGLGAHITSNAGPLSQIHIYIYADPAPFQWVIHAMENGKPAVTPLAEGTAQPTETGWHIIEMNNLTVPQDFVIGIIFLESYKPQLGMAVDGEFYRWWLYSITRGWVNVMYRPIMVKAVIDSGAISPQRLTDHNAVDRYPAISPDGTKIAFMSERAGRQDIWLMDIDGSNLTNLTAATGNSSLPAWSPDGKNLTFVSDRDGNQEIYVMDLQSGETTRITHDEHIDTEPVWNNTGSNILFASDRDGSFEIYTMNVSNPSPQRVTRGIGNLREAETGNLDPSAIETHAIQSSSAKTRLAANIRQSPQFSPSAVGEIKMDLLDGEAEPGSPVSMTIQLENVQQLGNLAFEIEYEPNVLRLLDAPAVQLQTAHSLYEFNPIHYPTNFSPFRFNWISAEGWNEANAQIQLAFEVLADTLRSETNLKILSANAYDVSLNSIHLLVNDGIVRILGNQTPIRAWMLY
ncbi:MAG: hypothetical protein C4527_06885 [Candidatus Omnitrophota bacterium]|jgi:parallel beta-helix repeat protein|nr:MAG: hypothetical protein C4527_06885 [Candidatus Omnitrophota bacterium]